MSEPWSRTTVVELQEKARKLGLADTGSREQLYHRIEQHLRAEVERLDASDEEEALVEAARVTHALAVVPDVPALDDVTDSVMDAWRSGEDLPEPASTLPAMSRWAQMEAMAKVLSRSSLMPRHIVNSRDKEADCMVMLLTAHDLGLTSTLAFRKVHVIEGQPSLAAELMRVLIQRDGHDIRINASPDQAEVLIHRKEWADGDWRGATFTMQQARDAGLTNKGPWKAYGEDMLVARATSRAARRYCPDSLGGISYTPEELGAIDVDGVDWTSPSPTPEPELLTPEHRTQIEFAIEVLEDTQREWLRAQWKAKGIPALSPRPGHVGLTEAWVPTISALLAEASQQPSEAVVVDEEEEDPPTGALVPPTQSAADKVDSLRESIELADTALAGSKSERAAIARRVLDEAKQRAEAANVIDAMCPGCGKPMKEDNKACKVHPL